jgi:uncharacterized protein YlxW (UPF0749 family)
MGNKPKWAIAFVMMVLGLLLSTQFRVQQQATSDAGRLRADELARELSIKEEELEAASERVAELERQVAELQRSLSSVSPAPAEDSTDLRILAGNLEVTGPGVIVLLSEKPEALEAKNRVSDEDIWRVLNELFVAGAEAASVNGQRVTSITGIRNVGGRILVNQTMIASPVEIQAVGDPVVLDASLKLRGGVIELLDRWGINVTISKSDSLIIPATRTTPVLHYAKPVEKKTP